MRSEMALDESDSFPQNFQKSLIDQLLDNEPTWNAVSPNKDDLKIDFKDVGLKHPINNIQILLNDQFTNEGTNENQIQHANEFDVTEFECVEELPNLSAKDLIIKEVIADLILRTFSSDYDSNNRSKLSNNLHVENYLDNDDEISDSETDIPRVRRCSSLKTGKTPPGTPSCKKIVRFADVLGLDLADVRTYLDDIPRVPSSAYKDLINCEIETCCAKNSTRCLLALFQQPVSLPNFLGRLTMNMVLVENAYVDDPVSFCIKGCIRVRNVSFHKSVHVRYTLDKWKKSSDVEATYVDGSSDGFTDRFQFMLYAYGLEIGAKLEFAVRYRVDGQEFWDNNNGHNYCFQCLPVETPQQAPMTPGINEQFVTFYYNDKNCEMETDSPGDPDASTCQETVFNDTNSAKCPKSQLSSSEVQEIIARSLGKHKMADVTSGQGLPKPEVLLFLIVLFLSIVLFYAKRLLF